MCSIQNRGTVAACTAGQFIDHLTFSQTVSNETGDYSQQNSTRRYFHNYSH